jgi:malate dehydrogenase
MREIAIVGAGELGGLIAHGLARRNAADVIRLLDDTGRVAEGKALDISQAAPLERFSASVSGSADLSTAAGAEIVVIADRAAGAEREGEDGIALLRRLTGIAPRAVVVCAGASHCTLVERGVRELHVPRARIIGSAAEAFAAAAIAIVALSIDASPGDVSLPILGVPPSHIMIGWDHATHAGFRLTATIGEPLRRQLTRQITALWPVGPHALAAAACKVVGALLGDSLRVVTCFIAPDDTAGVRMRTAALPARLGPGGVVEVFLPPLSVAERVALDNAILI